jgi:hypothetical protein
MKEKDEISNPQLVFSDGEIGIARLFQDKFKL